MIISSYNIHACIGTDNEYRPDRIAAVLNEINASIDCLQEVDTGYRIKVKENQLELIAQLTQKNIIKGPTIQHKNGFYGNAILTNLPVISVKKHDISQPDTEPRGLLDVDLAYNDKVVRVITTHLGLKSAERKKQAREIVNIYHSRSSDITILCGDFNDWLRCGPAIRKINQEFGRTKSPRTFPSFFPVLPLDKIWVRSSNIMKYEIHTHKTSLSKKASDHIPVYMTSQL